MRNRAGLRLMLLVVVCLSAGCRGAAPASAGPLASLERSLLFHPVKYPDGNWQPASLPVEDAWFTAADGTKIHGWYCPHPNPRAIALYNHGNGGNVTYLAGTLRQLNRTHQLTVLAFDYRGYGRSEGTPNEEGILQDARAARAWLAKRAAVRERDIVLIGRSLGGAVAVDLAAEDGARGLIVESSFTSLPEVAKEHFSWVPTGLIMRNRLNSRAKLSRYRGPLLISHGDADRVIPYEHGKRLFAGANEPKHFVTIPGGGHNDPPTRKYSLAFDEFIATLNRRTATNTVPGPSGQLHRLPAARE